MRRKGPPFLLLLVILPACHISEEERVRCFRADVSTPAEMGFPKAGALQRGGMETRKPGGF
jgi:hypothetical protein